MSAGGYIYEQVNLAYDANTNGATIRSWALAVHVARCKAFLLAAQREAASFGGEGWSVVQTNLYDEFYEYDAGANIYIQDIHPTSVDTTGEYPAFVTFFSRNNNSEEYCIITYSGFNANTSYTNQSTHYNYGLYIPRASLTRGPANLSNYVSCGSSMSHAFAPNGFGNYNVCSNSFLTTGCTHIMASYDSNDGSYTAYTNSSNSLIGSRSNSISNSNLVDKTYQFGYAIKGTHIITLERRHDADGWLWSIIGNIFGTLITDGDTYSSGCLLNDYYSGSSYETGSSHSGMISENGSMEGRVCFCTSSGARYKPSSSLVYLCTTRATSYFGFSPCFRTDNTIPTDTTYNAVGVGAVSKSYNTITGDLGIDGQSNGAKGFIDTSLLRQVSAGVCQNVGATFQGGNFVSMKASYSMTTGFLLGWDSSNQSIM